MRGMNKEYMYTNRVEENGAGSRGGGKGGKGGKGGREEEGEE